MKIIDLLNKIANGEEVPKFKYEGKVYEYNKDNEWFTELYNDEKCKGEIYFCELNDEIEIINDKKILQFDKEKVKIGNSLLEEEKKMPEKLELPSFNEFKTMTPEARYVVTAKEYDVLNDIIDYLESKGE